MARFVIKGGKKLTGTVLVSGAKNEALKLIPLSILLNGPVTITNVPHIIDIEKQLKIYESIGGKYVFEKDRLYLDGREINKARLVSSLARKLRASIVFLGPLLARFGKVNLPSPGGCLIGARPIDTHTDAFRQLGAEVTENKLNLSVELTKPKLNHVVLSEQSVTATENLMFYASRVEETVILENCAIEPEVVQIERLLEEAGAKIEGIGTRQLKITGSKNLSLKKISVMSDRVEAATFVIALIVTRGKGKVCPYPKEGLESFNELLLKIGAKFKIKNDCAYVSLTKDLLPFSISTGPHPGFPTDLQSPTSLLAAVGRGKSKIHETMYENRLAYINELKKMGLNATLTSAHRVEITGPTKFHATKISSLDLRSGITMLLAGLMADGTTIVEKAEIIDRGYERVEEKLRSLGAQIERVK